MHPPPQVDKSPVCTILESSYERGDIMAQSGLWRSLCGALFFLIIAACTTDGEDIYRIGVP